MRQLKHIPYGKLGQLEPGMFVRVKPPSKTVRDWACIDVVTRLGHLRTIAFASGSEYIAETNFMRGEEVDWDKWDDQCIFWIVLPNTPLHDKCLAWHMQAMLSGENILRVDSIT